MRKIPQPEALAAADLVAPEPEAAPEGAANLPDLTQEPLATMAAIWKEQGAPLCDVCGYQVDASGKCVWDPTHEQKE